MRELSMKSRQFHRLAHVVTIALLITGQGCRTAAQQQADRDLEKVLVGTWTEYLLIGGNVNAMAIHRFALDEQDNLTEVLKYEYGVQCRIWSGLDNVSVRNGVINLYDEFEGSFSPGQDSVALSYRTRSGGALEFLLVRAQDEAVIAFMDSLEACRFTPYKYREPEKTGDGITCASLEDMGVKGQKILELMSRIGKGHFRDLHSLLVIKNDTLVLEEYFGGRGQLHGPFLTRQQRKRVHQLASCTKSVNSILLGIARDRGMIAQLDTPVAKYFSEYPILSEGGREAITLKDFLSMSAGFEWNELAVDYEDRANDVNLMWQAEDPLAYLFAKEVVDLPGTVFNYNSAVSTALGEVLRRATGSPVDSFAVRELFAPLGIEQYEWTRHSSGIVSTGGGLSLTSRDLAKIGLLVLHRGRWNGSQLVSSEWLDESTAPQIRTSSGPYSYQWWIRTLAGGGKATTAIGLGGNFLTIFPERNLVVVATAQDFDRGWSGRYFTILEEYILPSFQ